jgi:RHS repeat-associated protein
MHWWASSRAKYSDRCMLTYLPQHTQGVYANLIYDANGNVTNDRVHTYQYDAENRVVSVDSGFTATYAYNHDNQRVKKVAGGATTHSIWNGSRTFAEYNGTTGALLVQYINANNRMVAKIEGGVMRYVMSDRLSARVILDASGNVIGRQGHLPFGEDMGLSGSPDKHRFTNYIREDGFDYAGNRTYSPALGRFNQSDPYQSEFQARIPQSWNRFSYVINSPTTFTDPTGLKLEMPNDSSECEALGNFYFGRIPVACVRVQVGRGPIKIQDQCEVKVRWRFIKGTAKNFSEICRTQWCGRITLESHMHLSARIVTPTSIHY